MSAKRKRPRRRLASDRLLRPELFLRILCYGLLILCLATAETSFFSALSFLPATPDLLLGAVVGVALLDNRRASLIFAMASGLVLDAVGGVGIPLTALIYVVISQVAAFLGEKMLPGFGSYLVLLIPSLLLREGLGLLEILSVGGTDGLLPVLWRVVWPDLWVTALFVIPMYGMVKLCMLPFRERKRGIE